MTQLIDKKNTLMQQTQCPHHETILKCDKDVHVLEENLVWTGDT